jgi:superfamily II DNA/RNA helicase
LHGNKSQRAREEALSAFRQGQVQTLLATNVAARGLDIQGISQVINYELPESSELFTHRVGRTGRMGREGKAITLLAPADLPQWKRMTRSLGQTVAVQRLAIDKTHGEIPATTQATPETIQTAIDFPAPERPASFRQRNERRESGKRHDADRSARQYEQPAFATRQGHTAGQKLRRAGK